MNTPNWERLRIFSAVLESASLSEAARKLHLSQPTVSRQVRALERELEAHLLDVTPDGAFPTEAGLRLRPLLDEMKSAARNLVSQSDGEAHARTVRITCGPWMAMFLNRNLDRLTGTPVDSRIETVSSIEFADLPRREAEIAIRNRRPTNPRLVLRRLPDYTCAVYGARQLVQDRPSACDDRRFSDFDWAALAPELDHLPTARWLSARLTKEPIVRCSNSTNLLDAVRSARVLAVIPCFAVFDEAQLERVSEPFIPDYDGHWLVLADDVRRRPHVRLVADRVIDLLTNGAPQVAGNFGAGEQVISAAGTVQFGIRPKNTA